MNVGLWINNSVLSGGTAIIPVFGVNSASDVGLLIELLPKITRRFGLSPKQLDNLDSSTKMFIANLIIKLDTQLFGAILTKQLIMHIFKESRYTSGYEVGC